MDYLIAEQILKGPGRDSKMSVFLRRTCLVSQITSGMESQCKATSNICSLWSYTNIPPWNIHTQSTVMDSSTNGKGAGYEYSSSCEKSCVCPINAIIIINIRILHPPWRTAVFGCPKYRSQRTRLSEGTDCRWYDGCYYYWATIEFCAWWYK